MGKSKEDRKEMQEGEFGFSRSSGERQLKGGTVLPCQSSIFLSPKWSSRCLLDLTIWKDKLLTPWIRRWHLQNSLL